ncbi:hypothetical protein IG193_05775 [Infirmifilum lucidum]|uniref:Uncharacterized protein n=1 Tax=Infirmifilum lucidum TaxID=2776706 RepID=A0A7L9FF13_9CREN|nr:hypothetical protein [Infirmifilum lucidum]QOJ78277.1 hypothetical protein IG193_05775 [Infirmifilum lucidum]
MVDVKLLERLLEWARANNAVIDVSFQDTSYRLRINKMFRAVDSGGNVISWAKAFGAKKPAELFGAFKVKAVTLKLADKQHTFRSLEELLQTIRL